MKQEYELGHCVRVTSGAVAGKEGVVEDAVTIPYDGRWIYLVKMGEELVWCDAKELERVWKI